MSNRNPLLLAAATALLGAGCPASPPEPPSGMPAIAERASAPNPPARGPSAVHPPSGDRPGEAALPPGHPTVGATLPAGHPPLPAEGAAGAAPFVGHTPGGALDPNEILRGALTLAEPLRRQAQAGDVLFLVARVDDGSDKGTILGVKRLVVGAWPQPFQLDGRDAMQPGTKLSGKVLLTARIDKDGDAISKQPGDLLGTLRTEVGPREVKLVIDKVTD